MSSTPLLTCRLSLWVESLAYSGLQTVVETRPEMTKQNTKYNSSTILQITMTGTDHFTIIMDDTNVYICNIFKVNVVCVCRAGMNMQALTMINANILQQEYVHCTPIVSIYVNNKPEE